MTWKRVFWHLRRNGDVENKGLMDIEGVEYRKINFSIRGLRRWKLEVGSHRMVRAKVLRTKEREGDVR